MQKEYIEEYKKILNDKKNSLQDIVKKTEKWRPKFLYRYRRFDDKEYWKSDVFEGQIYMSETSKFNDPMDCLLYFDLSKAPQDNKLYRWLCKEHSLKNNEVIEFLSNEEKLTEILERYKEDIVCACFTESYDNLLMWSHYASSHTGFCIEYNVDKLGEMIKENLYPVLYTNEKPDITEEFCNMENNAIIKGLISKANEWSYEEEWRILRSKNSFEGSYYARKAINTIYLGSKCTDKNKKIICDRAKTEGKTVVQMKVDLKEYKLISKK